MSYSYWFIHSPYLLPWMVKKATVLIMNKEVPPHFKERREENRLMRNSRARHLRKMKLKKQMETSLAKLHEENADLRHPLKNKWIRQRVKLLPRIACQEPFGSVGGGK